MLRRTVFLLALLLLGIAPVVAQDNTITVTTINYVSFREGPGLAFERTAVIPPNITLTAVGRSVNGDWFQVHYNGELGWLSRYFTTWIGDPVDLDTDGIDPDPFVRVTGPIIIAFRDTPYYPDHTPFPETRVGTLASGTRLEMTGRYGMGDLNWYQFELDGRYYWAGSWNFVIDSVGVDVPDASAAAPYGRLLAQAQRNLRRVSSAYNRISGVWRGIASGSGVSCNRFPEPVDLEPYSLDDLAEEPAFVPVVRALEQAVRDINNAVALFEQTCASLGADRIISAAVVTEGLDLVDSAEVNLLILEALVRPLSNFDPTLSGDPIANRLEAVDMVEVNITPQPTFTASPFPTLTYTPSPTFTPTIQMVTNTPRPTATPTVTPTVPLFTTPTG